jgi:hypothetical protein
VGRRVVEERVRRGVSASLSGFARGRSWVDPRWVPHSIPAVVAAPPRCLPALRDPERGCESRARVAATAFLSRRTAGGNLPGGPEKAWRLRSPHLSGRRCMPRARDRTPCRTSSMGLRSRRRPRTPHPALGKTRGARAHARKPQPPRLGRVAAPAGAFAVGPVWSPHFQRKASCDGSLWCLLVRMHHCAISLPSGTSMMSSAHSLTALPLSGASRSRTKGGAPPGTGKQLSNNVPASRLCCRSIRQRGSTKARASFTYRTFFCPRLARSCCASRSAPARTDEQMTHCMRTANQDQIVPVPMNAPHNCAE